MSDGETNVCDNGTSEAFVIDEDIRDSGGMVGDDADESNTDSDFDDINIKMPKFKKKKMKGNGAKVAAATSCVTYNNRKPYTATKFTPNVHMAYHTTIAMPTSATLNKAKTNTNTTAASNKEVCYIFFSIG